MNYSTRYDVAAIAQSDELPFVRVCHHDTGPVMIATDGPMAIVVPVDQVYAQVSGVFPIDAVDSTHGELAVLGPGHARRRGVEYRIQDVERVDREFPKLADLASSMTSAKPVRITISATRLKMLADALGSGGWGAVELEFRGNDQAIIVRPMFAKGDELRDQGYGLLMPMKGIQPDEESDGS